MQTQDNSGRASAPWETSAPAPFLTFEGSRVAVWTLGEGRFRITAPGREDREVVGFDLARVTAQALAGTPPVGVDPEDYDPGAWGDNDA